MMIGVNIGNTIISFNDDQEYSEIVLFILLLQSICQLQMRPIYSFYTIVSRQHILLIQYKMSQYLSKKQKPKDLQSLIVMGSNVQKPKNQRKFKSPTFIGKLFKSSKLSSKHQDNQQEEQEVISPELFRSKTFDHVIQNTNRDQGQQPNNWIKNRKAQCQQIQNKHSDCLELLLDKKQRSQCKKQTRLSCRDCQYFQKQLTTLKMKTKLQKIADEIKYKTDKLIDRIQQYETETDDSKTQNLGDYLKQRSQILEISAQNKSLRERLQGLEHEMETLERQKRQNYQQTKRQIDKQHEQQLNKIQADSQRMVIKFAQRNQKAQNQINQHLTKIGCLQNQLATYKSQNLQLKKIVADKKKQNQQFDAVNQRLSAHITELAVHFMDSSDFPAQLVKNSAEESIKQIIINANIIKGQYDNLVKAIKRKYELYGLNLNKPTNQLTHLEVFSKLEKYLKDSWDNEKGKLNWLINQLMDISEKYLGHHFQASYLEDNHKQIPKILEGYLRTNQQTIIKLKAQISVNSPPKKKILD